MVREADLTQKEIIARRIRKEGRTAPMPLAKATFESDAAIRARNIAGGFTPQGGKKVVTTSQIESPTTPQVQAKLAIKTKTQQVFDQLRTQVVVKRRKETQATLNTRAGRLKERFRQENIQIQQQRRSEQEKGVVKLVKEGNIPAVVRQSFRKVGGVFVSAGEAISRKKLTPEEKLKGEALVGETFLLSTLGGVKTRAQITREAIPTGVAVVGVTSQEGTAIKTVAAFKTTKGQKGFAESVGLSKGDVTVSVVKGRTIGKILGPRTKDFGGVQVSKTTGLPTGLEETFSFGTSAEVTRAGSKNINKFIAGSVSKSSSSTTVGASAVGSTQGRSNVAFIFAKKQTPTKTFTLEGLGGSQSQVQQQQLKGIAEVIGASVKQEVTTPKGFTAIPSFIKPVPTSKVSIVPSLSSLTKAPQTTATITATQVSTLPQTRTFLNQPQIFQTRSSTRQGTNFAIAQPQASSLKISPLPRLKTITTTTTAQATALKIPVIPRTTVRSAPTPIPVIPTTPIGGPLFIPFRQPRTQARTGRSRLFSVSVGTGGKFQTVRRGLSLGKALSFGALRTGRTSATAFRVAPIRGTPLPSGARTPKGFKRKRGTSLTFIQQDSIKSPTFKL